ncbi:MAG: nucleotidyltransferase domain-containing protein [Chloroflexota bacterium]
MGKTVLELTPEELEQYHPERQRPPTWPPEVRARAWEQARQAARVLREQFGATRVVVFGSLAHNLWYSERSDIDIAVWGIAPEDFFQAVADVNTVGVKFEINLVDPTTARPFILEAIQHEGIDL